MRALTHTDTHTDAHTQVHTHSYRLTEHDLTWT